MSVAGRDPNDDEAWNTRILAYESYIVRNSRSSALVVACIGALCVAFAWLGFGDGSGVGPSMPPALIADSLSRTILGFGAPPVAVLGVAIGGRELWAGQLDDYASSPRGVLWAKSLVAFVACGAIWAFAALAIAAVVTVEGLATPMAQLQAVGLTWPSLIYLCLAAALGLILGLSNGEASAAFLGALAVFLLVVPLQEAVASSVGAPGSLERLFGLAEPMSWSRLGAIMIAASIVILALHKIGYRRLAPRLTSARLQTPIDHVPCR